MRFLFCIFLLITIGCEAKEEIRLSKVKMSDGRIVDNCIDYNSLRQEVGLFDSNRNKSIAAEYLECSYFFAVGEIEGKDEVLDLIYDKLKVANIPLSISSSINSEATFKSLKWSIDYKNSKIFFEKDDVNIVILLEKKLNDGYLIFVVNEVLKGTYRAYFPAKLIETDTGFEISPIYKTGF